MQPTYTMICTSAIAALVTATPALADTMRSPVAFNNGIGQKTASQPAEGVEVAYQVTLAGGRSRRLHRGHRRAADAA